MNRQRKIAIAGFAGAMALGAGTGVVLSLPTGAGAGGSTAIAPAATDGTDDTSGTDSTGTTDTTAPAADDTGTDAATPADAPARAGGLRTILDGLVADGTITQAQEDAILAGIEANRPAGPDGDHAGFPGGPGRGGHGHGGPGGMGFGFGSGLDAAAEALGMTTDELRTELQADKTVADVAAEKGVDVQTVIDAIVQAATADLTERVTDAVNGVKPTPPAPPTDDSTATTTPTTDAGS